MRFALYFNKSALFVQQTFRYYNKTKLHDKKVFYITLSQIKIFAQLNGTLYPFTAALYISVLSQSSRSKRGM